MFVVLVGGALAGSPSVSPLGIGLDLSYDTVTSAAGTTGRTLASRTADTFNVRDFGALGTGTSQTIGTTYGGTLAGLASYITSAGTTPFAWATNPIYGLTFTLNTSVAQGSAGTSLTFVSSLTVGGATLSLASWIVPANGQDLMQTGMQVSGACIATGTTVSAIATTAQTYSAGGATADTGAVPTGAITLSQSTSAACAAGTAITFTISPTQLAALTTDWLGMQSAVAAAYSAFGATVWLPAGAYYKNRPVVVPTFTNPNYTEQVEIKGDGVGNTQVYDTSDTGPFSCSMGEMNRGTGSTGHFLIHDIRLFGPGSNNSVGNAVAGMDGICLGAKARTQRISIGGYHAGINVLEDHQLIVDSEVGNNFYGIYMAPNGDVYGNLAVQQGGGTGEAWAAVAVAWNNTLDGSRWNGFYTGYSPYGFYRELPPSGQMVTGTFISNAYFDNDYSEALGNGWIYDENGPYSIENTTFTQIITDVSGGSGVQIPGRGVKAVIYTAGGIFSNRFSKVTFANGPNQALVADGLLEALVNVQANQFDDVTNEILNSSKPILVSPGAVIFNFFTMDRAQGEFRRAETNLAAGEVVAHGVYGIMNSVRGMAVGYVPLGVVAQAQSAGAIVPVVTRGIVPTAKTTDVAISNATAVCVSAASPTAVTACTNAPTQAPIGVDEDGAAIAASATSAIIYVQIGPQPSIATASAPGIVSPDGSTITINAAGKISATPAAIGAAVIGAVTYDPSADVGYACNGFNNTATADVDATNLQVSFVAPASGNVLVALNAMVTSHTTGWQVYWSIGFASSAGGASSSDIAGTLGMVTNSSSDLRVTHAVRLTGLTAGTTYLVNWRQSTNQTSAQTGPFMLVGQTSTPYGPATMIVYSD